MEDAAGIAGLMPIGRWKGYRGATDCEGNTLDDHLGMWCLARARGKEVQVFTSGRGSVSADAAGDRRVFPLFHGQAQRRHRLPAQPL